MLIRSQRVCQNKDVLSIIFDARWKITIAEAIQLFWVNRENAKVSGKKFFNQSASIARGPGLRRNR
jgi:hypothetical protein